MLGGPGDQYMTKLKHTIGSKEIFIVIYEFNFLCLTYLDLEGLLDTPKAGCVGQLRKGLLYIPCDLH